MTVISVLLAFFLEQARALTRRNFAATLLQYHALRAAQSFDTGQRKHGVLAWLSVVLPWTLATAAIYYLLYKISFIFAFAWNVTVVYFSLGFRQFSYYFADIHEALNREDLPRARQILHQWSGIDTTEMPVGEIVRHTLIYTILAAHRHVFGVFFWFLIPIGPAGAVLYRIAEYLARTWVDASQEHSGPFTHFAQTAFQWIDWLPVRLTALGFAIVGNFEEAMYACAHYARQWPNLNDGMLVSAGGGALGVRLVEPLAVLEPNILLEGEVVIDNVPPPIVEDYAPRNLQSAVGLVSRAVVLWLIGMLALSVMVWIA